MGFLKVCIVMIVVLGVVAAIATVFSEGGSDTPINKGHDCATCSSMERNECKIGCLLEEKKRQKDNKTES